MPIRVTPEQDAAIRAHGEETFPHECCGFILGRFNGEDRNAVELLQAENAREDEAQKNRFLIDPRAFMKAEKAAREKGLDMIGIYHSHPNAPARPSQYDLDHAWPLYSYVIVSILEGSADAMTSWLLKDDRSAFDEETIRIGDAN